MVTSNRITQSGEKACQSTRWICSGNDKGFSDNGPHSKNYSQITWYLLHKGALSSVILLGEGGKEALEVTCKNIYYYGSTKDLAFI